MMRTKLIIIILLMVCAFITVGFLLTYQTGSNFKSADQQGKIGVIVTVPPQAEFAKAVGGDRVQVTVMVPPGADPHTYEPLPKQMQELSDAQIYMAVGSPIEFELTYMDRIKRLNPSMKVVNSSKGIQFIPSIEEHGGDEHNETGDPHVWVSPKNARIMVNNTYQALVEADPDNQQYYQNNRERYLSKLDSLDKNITNSLQGVQNKRIMVYHPAWGYFARDYGIEQISIQIDGKEPSPQQIEKLVLQAQRENIKVVFVSPQFNQKSAEVISSEIGGTVVAIDPLAENYLENMKKVLESFQNSMR